MRRLLVSFIGLAVLGFASSTTANASTRYFEVTITNITADQIFTPLLVASHTAGMPLFTLEAPASPALEALAEGGDTGPLAAELGASPDVLDVEIAGGALPPGGSVTVSVKTRGPFKYVSVAGMLIPTNDAFVALNGVRGPKHGSVRFTVPAYDAGTEANNESCDNIPGPDAACLDPDSMRQGFEGTRDGAEGFVHVHRGIHGIGDLAPETYDWRNPVAIITIHRR
jgi:hypothetical protein